MFHRRPDLRVLQNGQLFQIRPQGCAAALLDHRAGALPPQVDVFGHQHLARPQLILLPLELVTVFRRPLEQQAADLLQAFADGHELVLDLVGLAVEDLLELSEPEADHACLASSISDRRHGHQDG